MPTPVSSHDRVPGGVVNVGTGLSLDISGGHGGVLTLVKLNGAVETLDVSWGLWVLNLGP